MLRQALLALMVLGLCTQIRASYIVNGHLSEEIEHMNQEIHALEHKVEELSQCHVDVHVHTEGDLTQSDGRAVDINLHVQEDHHDDELHEKHHEEHENLYANAHLVPCVDTHHNMHGEVHIAHFGNKEHLEAFVVVEEAQPNTEYVIKMYDHGDKGDHCDMQAAHAHEFDPEADKYEHKGEFGKFTTDSHGKAHVFMETHFSLRGGRDTSIVGHLISVDTPDHHDEAHAIVGFSDSHHEYHEFVKHHEEKDYDFGPEDVYAKCHLHAGFHDGHHTGMQGDIHYAQHVHGEHDMQIRVNVTGGKPNHHYKLKEYAHGDIGHECIDMGEALETLHHQKSEHDLTTDDHGEIHTILYHADYTMLSEHAKENIAGHGFAINDDDGHHEACCVVGYMDYDEEHHHFKHELGIWHHDDLFAKAVIKEHGDVHSPVTGEIHIRQHKTEEFSQFRADLEHFQGDDHEELHLWVDDHDKGAEEVTSCPHYDHLEEGTASHYIGDFHPDKHHEAHYTFDHEALSLKGDHSIIGSTAVIYDHELHAIGCGRIVVSDFVHEEHYYEEHQETHHV